MQVESFWQPSCHLERESCLETEPTLSKSRSEKQESTSNDVPVPLNSEIPKATVTPFSLGQFAVCSFL